MRYFSFIDVKMIVLVLLVIVLSAFYSPERVNQLQMDLLIYKVNNGKRFTTKGTVYYRNTNAKLVTHFTYPVELVSITNGLGEMQSYNIKNNSLLLQSGEDYSSKKSFIYHFMSGAYNDMGLPESGYKLTNSKIEDGLVITNWKIKEGAKKEYVNAKVEMVHENRYPIFMAFSNDGIVNSKTYYTNYTLVGDVRMPLNITEISYSNNGLDSVITRKKYSNVKLNNQVDLKYLNYQVPTDASIVKP